MAEANAYPDQPRRTGSPDQSSGTIDRSRVASLYAEHGNELRRFVLGVVRDADLAGDVIQATFTKAVEHGHTARTETLKGWLFRVAYHEALTVRRRQASRDQANRRLADLGKDPDDRPEDHLIRDETIDAVRRGLEHLPAEQRQIVLARMYDDKTFAEIARELGVPLGTVLTRMRLALDKLRRCLPAGE